MDASYLFQYSVGILSTSFLFFIGYQFVFRTKAAIKFYVKCDQSAYLNSLKMNFFFIKYYQALIKYQYETSKKSSGQSGVYFNMKIGGMLLLFMAVFVLFGMMHALFKLNFGLFTN